MPERIYMNRIAGQRRIHIEIEDHEVGDLLDDFTPADDAFDATKRLHQILRQAAADFATAARNDAYEAETSR
ncbi:hypothetical protein AB0K71_05945 [Streptomyces syringium]|uniref:hypothetical protein n=1 Tax=Streptomyces syringium TaxID=76729 RepID=UPI003424314D